MEQVQVDVGFLVAVVAQSLEQRADVLRPVVAAQRRHAHDRLDHNRVQVGVDGEQIPAVVGEQLDVVAVVQVEAARDRRENHAEAEHVGQRVVAAQGMFPTDVPGQVDRARNRLVAACDQ